MLATVLTRHTSLCLRSKANLLVAKGKHTLSALRLLAPGVIAQGTALPQGPVIDLFWRPVHEACSVDISTAQCASCGRLKANRVNHALLHLQGAAAPDGSKSSCVISDDVAIGCSYSRAQCTAMQNMRL